MWDEEDGFFYDVLRTPDGRTQQLKVRSMVGLLPLCATTVIERRGDGGAAASSSNGPAGSCSNRPHLVSNIHDPRRPGYRNRRLLSLLSEERLRRVLSRMLDENEFLSPYGIRSLSRHHLEHPYRSTSAISEFKVGYLPAESDSAMFGGNSNWRGPDLAADQRPARARAAELLRLLRSRLHRRVPDRLRAPRSPSTRSRSRSPSGSTRIFTADARGRRPLFGGRAEVHRRSPLARSPAVLRILPRRQRRGDRRQPPDRLDRADRVADSLLRDHLAAPRPSTSGRPPGRRRPPRRLDGRRRGPRRPGARHLRKEVMRDFGAGLARRVAALWSGDGAIPLWRRRPRPNRPSRRPRWAGAAAALSRRRGRRPRPAAGRGSPLSLHDARDRPGARGRDDLVPAQRRRRSLESGAPVAGLEAQDVCGRRHVRQRPLQHQRRRPPDGRRRAITRLRAATGWDRRARSSRRSSAPRSGSTSSRSPSTRRSTI